MYVQFNPLCIVVLILEKGEKINDMSCNINLGVYIQKWFYGF